MRTSCDESDQRGFGDRGVLGAGGDAHLGPAPFAGGWRRGVRAVAASGGALARMSAALPRVREPRAGLLTTTLATLATLAFVLAQWPLAARAQSTTASDVPDATFRPTRGLDLPTTSRAGEADALSVTLNPGQLPMLRASAGAFAGSLWSSSAPAPGRGAGLFLATPLGKGAGLGMALEGLGAADAGAIPGRTKFTLAWGLGGPAFGLGMSWAHLFGDRVGGMDTFDVGAATHPLTFLGLAVVLEDAFRPRVPGATERLPRRWVGNLALRPTGTERVELGVGVLHVADDDWSKLGYRLRAQGRVAGPFRLFAEAELAPRRAGAAGTEDGQDWRVGAGFAVDLRHGSVALGGRRMGVPSGASGAGAWGGSLLLRSSGETDLKGVGSANVLRVDLDDLEDDRAFLATVLRLRDAAADVNVAAVLFRAESLDLGLGRIEELRDLIAALRDAGKPTIAYVTFPSTRELYLASACDRIVAHPAGVVTFAGLSQTVTFYKGALDRLGVSVELVRIAEFKGAMEPFVMNEQSGPVRMNRNALLDDVYARVLTTMARERVPLRSPLDPALGLAPGAAPPAQTAQTASAAPAAPAVARAGLPGSVWEPRRVNPNPAQAEADLRALVEMGTFTPEQALAVGLIDAVRDDHEVVTYLKELLDRRDVAFMDPDNAPVRPARWRRRRIAVLMVDGTIIDGKSRGFPLGGSGMVGSETLVDAVDECRRDPSVAAVVLRVNSPGGSAFASDVIARAVKLLHKAGKPVIASFGDVAASGGYYVSAGADAIFAEPSTTTGSIGIFGYKVDVSRLMSMLSLSNEVYKRGPHADQLSPYRPWTDDERATAEDKIRHMYDTFVGVVADGRRSRGLTRAKVNELGRGHIWTGGQARELGLVDQFGGLGAAIERASADAGLPSGPGERPELVVLPRQEGSLLRKLMQAESEATGDAAPGSAGSVSGPAAGLAGPAARALRAATRLLSPVVAGSGEGVEARLPFDIETR